MYTKIRNDNNERGIERERERTKLQILLLPSLPHWRLAPKYKKQRDLTYTHTDIGPQIHAWVCVQVVQWERAWA